MDDAKSQLVDRIKTSNNILVTVSRNPSVDQLAGCIGLALLLNKQGKHTAAVFSGKVPSTLEFLQPESTLEKTTDSLRDFIIALDKSKADKLRYKVENDVVRIFITPYKTSISEADLEFSQGDFNVDLVVALGVARQEDLDEAITAHGRILHDATFATINIEGNNDLGSINWQDPQASSLCELVSELTQSLAPELVDEQIATALLTGIVAETNRFSNDKTSSQTMSISAALMAAGANQQLIASKLEEPESQAPLEEVDNESIDDEDKPNPDGTIEIDHSQEAEDTAGTEESGFELPTPDDNDGEESGPPADSAAPQEGDLGAEDTKPLETKRITEPPSLGGTLTASAIEKPLLEPSTDPLSMPTEEAPKLLERKPSLTPPPAGWTPPASPSSSTLVPTPPQVANPVTPQSSAPTLSELEDEVKKSEGKTTANGLDDAREEVSRAVNSSASVTPPPPIQALNAQPLGDSLHADSSASKPPALPSLEDQIPGLNQPTSETAEQKTPDSNTPPPVPPPIPFSFGANPPE